MWSNSRLVNNYCFFFAEATLCTHSFITKLCIFETKCYNLRHKTFVVLSISRKKIFRQCNAINSLIKDEKELVRLDGKFPDMCFLYKKRGNMDWQFNKLKGLGGSLFCLWLEITVSAGEGILTATFFSPKISQSLIKRKSKYFQSILIW